MDWLRDNWLWIAIGIAFLWMHGRMHGSHGGGGHHHHQKSENRAADQEEQHAHH